MATTVLGYAYASRHRDRAAYQWSIDVSVYVRADAHRRGIGRALYAALLRIVTAQGFYRAYAGITLPNASSVGLHEAMGFRPVGVYRAVGYKLGAWHDVGWWDLALAAAGPAPPPPRSVKTTRMRRSRRNRARSPARAPADRPGSAALGGAARPPLLRLRRTAPLRSASGARLVASAPNGYAAP